ncbi:MAG: PQQ-binding-like beta-propeller repeat protein [Alphaproteobacteria bacterium]|nr:PQQ-binding-like beta-propeller repeat protein [Alphaproteobacteria bacterium]
MTKTPIRLLAIMCAAALLSGCMATDMISDLFRATKKSNLKGERISVLSLDESLKPDDALKDTPVVLPAPYVNTEWPEPGGYASNAMYHLEANGPLHIVWQQDAGEGSNTASQLTASPIVADNKIFVLDAQTAVHAFDARNGTPLWTRSLAPKEGGEKTMMYSATFGLLGSNTAMDPSKGFGGGLAFENGKVFVSTGFGDVVALSASDGKQIWKTNLDVPIVNAPVANGGRVFVSNQENHFFALAQIDGRKLWDHQGISENAGILKSTSAAVAGEYVIVPYSSGELFAIRVQNGRMAWSDMLTRSGGVTALSELDDIAGRPVVDRDMVFAVSHSGIMAAINLSTGARVWSRDVGGIQTPWVAGDFLYVLTIDSQLLCLQRSDGRVKWIHQLQRWEDMDEKRDAIVWSGPVLVSNRLILASSHGYAVSVSPYTGDLLGRMEIPDGTFVPPVVANGTIYILTNNAELVALR